MSSSLNTPPDYTDAEKRFLASLKNIFNANGGASIFQEEVTTTLTNAAMKQGTLSEKEILDILAKAKSDDMEMRAALEKQYGRAAGKVDYDEEIPLPQIQYIIEKSGIISNER